MPRYDESNEPTRSSRRRYSTSRSPEPYRKSRDREWSDRTQGERSSRSIREEDHDSNSHKTTSRKRSYSPHAHSRNHEDSRRDRRERSDRRSHGYDHRPSKRRRSHSRSNSPRRPKQARSLSPLPLTKFQKPLPSQADVFTKETTVTKGTPPPEKQKPNFSNTGRLAAASNTITSSSGQAIVLKYHEPPEARKPSSRDAWRMYVFKGSEIVDTVELAMRSCWLFGREQAVADIPIEHPSCSKQHAVIQFRYIEKRNEFGDKSGKVRPYVIDLESANGTSVGGENIPGGRYVELRDGDVLRLGHSSREYVVQLPPKE